MKALICSLALLVVAMGCGQILGIENAHVDPSLADVVNGGAGGTPAQSAGSTSVGSTEQGGQPTQPGAGSAGEAEAAGDSSTSGGAIAGGGSAAGGGGAPEGGSLCERYCDAVITGCTDTHTQYIDRDACLATCQDFPEGAPGDATGNTVNCRLKYALKAPSEPYTYCTWAGPGGDGKCGSNCEGFCSVMMKACSLRSTMKEGDFFSNDSACLTTCAGLKDIGEYSANNVGLQKGADHIQCRIYHVGAAVAEDDPITHCPHAMGKNLCFDSAKP